MPYRENGAGGTKEEAYAELAAAVDAAKRADKDADAAMQFFYVYNTEKSAARSDIDEYLPQAREAVRRVEEQLGIARRAANLLGATDPAVRAKVYEIESLHRAMSEILAKAEERYG